MTSIGPHVLGIAGMTREQIEFILATAQQFREVNTRSVKKVPSLRGKTVINLFLEPSTRTRTSFEIAAKRMSADAINISAGTSSVTKGETLIDTALTLQAMAPDVVVLRHSESGASHLLAEVLSSCAIVNAGDGLHEHPSQALLDALTIHNRLGRLSDITLTMVGDVLRSRVARSNILLHRILGNKVRIVAPPTLARKEFEEMGVEVYSKMEDAVVDSDVIMSLRMKFEYLKDIFVPNLDEYSRLYCVGEKHMKLAKPDCLLMAPGPFVRGVEVDSAVVDGPQSLVSDQVENGVAVRMALLFLLTTGKGVSQPDIAEAGGI